MPSYHWLLTEELDFDKIPSRVRAMTMVGVPYSVEEVQSSVELAREQAAKIAAELHEQGGPAGQENKKVIALIAYLQRLGTDIMNSGSAEE